MGGRRRAAAAIGTVTLFTISTLTGLAANSATSDQRWPGVLDLLRRQAWLCVGVLFVVGLGLTLLQFTLDRDPGPVTGDPLPPLPPTVEDWWVVRAEIAEITASVRARNTASVALTTALKGAGGFGKTKLAMMTCADPRVRRHYRGRVYLVTIGRDIRSRAAISEKVADATRLITGGTTTFTDPDLAGDHLGQLLRLRPKTLLVLDDVWDSDQLAPFLRAAGPTCRLLITTRVTSLLPAHLTQIRVDQMTREQAITVLTRDLPALPAATFGRSPSRDRQMAAAAARHQPAHRGRDDHRRRRWYRRR